MKPVADHIPRRLQRGRPPRFGLACAALQVLFALLLTLVQAGAQQITLAGLTGTTLTLTGRTTTVTTTTILGGNAFNAFGKFSVNSGNTVRLIVPEGATNLINLIGTNSSLSSFNGALVVSTTEGLGGRAHLVSPGIIVGTSGSITAGDFKITTPTAEWRAAFFDTTNTPNPDAVAALLNGNVTVSTNNYVSCLGKISAQQGIQLRTGQVSMLGQLVSSDGEGPLLKEGNIHIESVEDVAVGVGSLLSAKNGGIFLKSDESVMVQMASRLEATGNVELRAGDEVLFAGGAGARAGANVVLVGGNTVRISDNGSVRAGGSVIMKSGNLTLITNTAFVCSQSVVGVPGATIRLAPGWNLVGYNSPLSCPLTNVLISIAGKYSMVCTHAGSDWGFYDPINSAGSTLTTFEPGVGYWINATEGATLELP